MKPPKLRNLKKFLSLAQERQLIWKRRQENIPWPWTKNPIFLRYKFCNVYREQDRVTQWIRKNWREPYKDHPNLWFSMCIARQINWPDTLKEIGFPEVWNPKEVLRVLNHRMKFHKTFTSAYLLGGGNNFGMSKSEYIVKKVLDPLSTQIDVVNSQTQMTLMGLWQWLCQWHGWGKFLSYEVVTDLRHTRYLCNAPDIMTWANIGPGARRGLNRLYERELDASGQPDEKLLEELLLITQWMINNKDNSILPTWEPRDTEHWLCEQDKYLRVEERLLQGKVTGLEIYHAPNLV